MKRLVRPALVAACLIALAATPALASHTHVMALGNGQCVLLAANGGEEDVTLPLAVFEHNPNVDIAPAPDRLTRSTSWSTRACPATTTRSRSLARPPRPRCA